MAADLNMEARHGGGRVFHFRPVNFLLINRVKQSIYMTIYIYIWTMCNFKHMRSYNTSIQAAYAYHKLLCRYLTWCYELPVPNVQQLNTRTHLVNSHHIDYVLRERRGGNQNHITLFESNILLVYMWYIILRNS